VLERISVPGCGVGRPRTRPDRVLADKAYTSRSDRRYLRRRNSGTPSPNVSTNKDTGTTEDPKAAGPPDSTANTTRSATPSNVPNRLKGFRTIATRYEKRACIYLGNVSFAALMVWLRT
jgi:hypothetical protein